MVEIIVPATSANLGPGFDCLGMAFNLYNNFKFYKKESGEDYSDNLIYISMKKLYDSIEEEMPPITIEVDADIPQSRGLGSSAACIIGGLLGANELSGANLSKEEILDLATEIEGHPDNVAPALFGGLIASVMEDSKVFINKMEVSNDFKFLLLIPDFELSTSLARDVLPKAIPFEDAVFNISRTVLLTKALETGDLDTLFAVKEDRLHQPYRKSLVANYDDFERLAKENNGALFLSGAGPTLLIIAKSDNDKIVEELQESIGKTDNNWKLLELAPDNTGAKR